MKEPHKPQPLFHAAHYNKIAARIREQLEEYDKQTPTVEQEPGLEGAMVREFMQVANQAMCDIALKLSKMFAMDNPNFSAAKFIDACTKGTSEANSG